MPRYQTVLAAERLLMPDRCMHGPDLLPLVFVVGPTQAVARADKVTVRVGIQVGQKQKKLQLKHVY